MSGRRRSNKAIRQVALLPGFPPMPRIRASIAADDTTVTLAVVDPIIQSVVFDPALSHLKNATQLIRRETIRCSGPDVAVSIAAAINTWRAP